MFLACQEETISNFRQCGRMTISDALPVQFWLNECETFNEYEAQGVHHVCWCAPWNCDDEIVVQFQHTTGLSMLLLAKDENGEYIYEAVIPEIQSGVYQTSLIPENQDICDELVQLLLSTDDSITRLLAPSDWDDGVEAFDSKSATEFTESALVSGDNEVSATMPIIIPEGAIVSLTFTIDISGTWAPSSQGVFVSFTLRDGLDSNVSTGTISLADKFITANGSYTFTETLTATATTATLKISLLGAISGTAAVDITVPAGQILYISNDSILAKSDCLDIQTAHDETTFFEYSNQRNFDGLIYANDSPDTTFGIRVPCRFFHQVEPEEDDAMELTSSIITTSSQVKTQRLLEVKHVPYYFHKKLRRVLKHQTLTIFDKAWKKEEKYEVNEGNKRWPLKSATCLLTEKNSVVRNVL